MMDDGATLDAITLELPTGRSFRAFFLGKTGNPWGISTLVPSKSWNRYICIHL